MKIPIIFAQKVKEPPKPGGGYPTQIPAKDLDRNFVYSALDANEGWIEESPGAAGFSGRKLTLPAIPNDDSAKFYFLALIDRRPSWLDLTPPSEGTYVLGARDGVIVWLETEDC